MNCKQALETKIKILTEMRDELKETGQNPHMLNVVLFHLRDVQKMIE